MAENVQPTATPGTDPRVGEPQPVQDAEYWRQQAIQQHQQAQAIQQQYQQDMEKVYNVLTNQQNQQPQPPPAQPEWDVTDPKQLRENVTQAVTQTISGQMTPVVLALAKNQFEGHMLNAARDERMPYFRTWEQEIRQLAQGVQPGLLAEYNTIVNLYQLVASRHGNELVELEVRKRLAQQQEAQHSDEVEVDDEPSEERSSQVSPPPSPHTPPRLPQPQQQPPPVAPVQSMQPARSTRTSSSRRLTREEAYMAQQMGMSLKEYAAAKDLGDYEL